MTAVPQSIREASLALGATQWETIRKVVLPAALADVPLDFDTLERHGSRIGAGAIVVLSDRDEARAAALGIAAIS